MKTEVVHVLIDSDTLEVLGASVGASGSVHSPEYRAPDDSSYIALPDFTVRVQTLGRGFDPAEARTRKQTEASLHRRRVS